MAIWKRLILLLTLAVLVALGVFVVRADHVPAPTISDPLEKDWGFVEPLKTQTMKRAEDVENQLQGTE